MLKDIIKKELKRVFTDRRLVFSTFIIPAISIYIIYTIIGNMMGNMEKDIDEHRSSVYISNAPESFTNYFDQIQDDVNMNVYFGDYKKADYEEQIRAGEVDLLVVFDDSFDERVQSYKDYENSPDIKTYYNSSENYSSEARDKFVYYVLEQYQNTLLTDRYGNINYVKAFSVDATNEESVIVDEKKASSSGLGMIMPMLLAILLFAGAMGIGMDTIAGEKERGTMATLLLTPVKRETIALGKVFSLGLVAIISAACSFIGIIASLPNMMSSFSGGGDSGMSLSFGIYQYSELLVIMIAMVGVFVGIICLISVRARTVKEAGTYVTPIYMVVMAGAMTTMFSKSGEVELYKFAIPVYGNITAIKELFAFELSLQEFALSTAVAFIIAGIIIKLITVSFNDEKIMLNA